jgi:hypothetical protein
MYKVVEALHPYTLAGWESKIKPILWGVHIHLAFYDACSSLRRTVNSSDSRPKNDGTGWTDL